MSSKRIPKATLVVVVLVTMMGSLLAKFDAGPKTASGEFSFLTRESVSENAAPALEACRENSVTVTIIVSGIPYWLSRDPIGEAGGLNLYGFVGNDPVNRWDYLGLAVGHHYVNQALFAEFKGTPAYKTWNAAKNRISDVNYTQHNTGWRGDKSFSHFKYNQAVKKELKAWLKRENIRGSLNRAIPKLSEELSQRFANHIRHGLPATHPISRFNKGVRAERDLARTLGKSKRLGTATAKNAIRTALNRGANSDVVSKIVRELGGVPGAKALKSIGSASETGVRGGKGLGGRVLGMGLRGGLGIVGVLTSDWVSPPVASGVISGSTQRSTNVVQDLGDVGDCISALMEYRVIEENISVRSPDLRDHADFSVPRYTDGLSTIIHLSRQ